MVTPVQYPHLASVFENIEAYQDANGNWVSGGTTEAKTFKCRAEVAIGTNDGLIQGADGAAINFNWIVYCPLSTPLITTGATIMVYGVMHTADSVKRYSRGQLNIRLWL